MVICLICWHPYYFRFSYSWKLNRVKLSENLNEISNEAWTFCTNFQSPIGSATYTGQVLVTELGKSLGNKLTSTRQAENWLKHLSSLGYAIAFDDGRPINIHLCGLSTLQTDPRKGCWDDQFSFLARSPGDPVQLGTGKCLVTWLSFSSERWGWGNTNQERLWD